MIKLYCLVFALFFATFATAQSEMNHETFTNNLWSLIEPQAETGYLINKTFPAFSPLSINTPQNQDPKTMWYNWFELYKQLKYAKSPISEVEDIYSIFERSSKNYLNSNTIDLGVMMFRYNEIDTNILRNNYSINGNLQMVVPSNILDAAMRIDTAFAIAPLIIDKEKRQVTFKIGQLQTNCGLRDSVFIQLRGTSEWQLVTSETGASLTLPSNSDSIIFNAKVFLGDTVYTTSFLLNILQNSHAYNASMACNVSASEIKLETGPIEYADTIYTYSTPALYSNAMSSDPDYVKGEYGVYFACCNTEKKIKKPIIICTGYSPFGGKNLNGKPGPFALNASLTSDLYSRMNGDLTKQAAKAMDPSGDIEPSTNNGNNLLYKLRNEGYDVIIIDFENSTDFPQNMGMAIIEVIKQVNDMKFANGSKHENVVLGYSMGSLAARWALARMDYLHNQNPSTNEHHHTRMFISHEGEFQGAHIPLAIQYQIQFLLDMNPIVLTQLLVNIAIKTQILTAPLGLAALTTLPFLIGYLAFDFSGENSLLMFSSAIVSELSLKAIGKEIINNPGAKSMLVYHSANNDDENINNLLTHSYFTQLKDDLDLYGYPKCRLVGIANGSSTNVKPEYGSIGQWIMDAHYTLPGVPSTLLINFEGRLEVPGVPTPVFNGSYKAMLGGINFPITIQSKNYVKTMTKAYSYAPGSYEEFYGMVRPIDEIADVMNYFSQSEAKDVKSYLAPFVPTTSALDVQNDYSTDFSYDFVGEGFMNVKDSTPNPSAIFKFGYPHIEGNQWKTPFHTVYASAVNEFHVGNPPKQIGEFVLKEMMPDSCEIQNRVFSSLNGIYKAKFESRGYLLAGNKVFKDYFHTPLGNVIVKPNVDLDFQATDSVVLKAGFKAEAGSTFRAYIEDMPDKCYTFKDQYGNISNKSESINDDYSSESEAQNLESIAEISIYPNPAHTEITISGIESARIEFYTLSGTLLYSTNCNQQQAISINNLASGFYLVNIIQPNSLPQTLKLIKQ